MAATVNHKVITSNLKLCATYWHDPSTDHHVREVVTYSDDEEDSVYHSSPDCSGTESEHSQPSVSARPFPFPWDEIREQIRKQEELRSSSPSPSLSTTSTHVPTCPSDLISSISKPSSESSDPSAPIPVTTPSSRRDDKVSIKLECPWKGQITSKLSKLQIRSRVSEMLGDYLSMENDEVRTNVGIVSFRKDCDCSGFCNLNQGPLYPACISL